MLRTVVWLMLVALPHVVVCSPTKVSGRVMAGGTGVQVRLETFFPQAVVASATLNDKGEFVFNWEVSKPDYFKVVLSNGSYISLIVNPGDVITLEIDANATLRPKISGSPQTESLYAFFGRLDALDKELEAHKQRIDTEKRTLLDRTANATLGQMSSLFLIEQVSQLNNATLTKKMVDSLMSRYSNNALVAELAAHYSSTNVTSTADGVEIPDIALPDTSGKVINLHSLRGKVVLVDFWASWCGPCRRENPHVVKLYDKYRDKGFEIYGVSVDRDRASWIRGIREDKITWVQVSDLKYWSSPVLKQFGIQGIPYTILLDKEGRIIAKGLRGETLEAQLQQIFGY